MGGTARRPVVSIVTSSHPFFFCSTPSVPPSDGDILSSIPSPSLSSSIPHMPFPFLSVFSFFFLFFPRLHPLQTILNRNRLNDLVTIVDLHRWNKSGTTEFWAKVPSKTDWYAGYIQRCDDVTLSLNVLPSVTIYLCAEFGFSQL